MVANCASRKRARLSKRSFHFRSHSFGTFYSGPAGYVTRWNGLFTAPHLLGTRRYHLS